MRAAAYRLLARAWEHLVVMLGTTTLSIVVFSFAVPVFIFLAVLVYHLFQAHKSGGRMKEAFRRTAIPTLIGVVVTLGAWACLFGWSIATTVYDDHRDLLTRIKELRTEKQKGEDASAKQIEDLKAHLKQQRAEKPVVGHPQYNVPSELSSDLIAELTRLLDQGTAAQNRFIATNDTEELKRLHAEWLATTGTFLEKKLGASYAMQFINAHGNAFMGCPEGRRVDGCGYWQDVQGKKDMLIQIVSEVRRR